MLIIVSDIAIFVLKRDVKLQLTNCAYCLCEIHIMLPSVNHSVDVLLQAGPGNSPGLKYRPGSDVIVLIEAGGFDSRKYGMQKDVQHCTTLSGYIFAC